MNHFNIVNKRFIMWAVIVMSFTFDVKDSYAMKRSGIEQKGWQAKKPRFNESIAVSEMTENILQKISKLKTIDPAYDRLSYNKQLAELNHDLSMFQSKFGDSAANNCGLMVLRKIAELK